MHGFDKFISNSYRQGMLWYSPAVENARVRQEVESAFPSAGTSYLLNERNGVGYKHDETTGMKESESRVNRANHGWPLPWPNLLAGLLEAAEEVLGVASAGLSESGGPSSHPWMLSSPRMAQESAVGLLSSVGG